MAQRPSFRSVARAALRSGLSTTSLATIAALLLVAACSKKPGAPAAPDAASRTATPVAIAADATVAAADAAATAEVPTPAVDVAGRVPTAEELEARPCWNGREWVARPVEPAREETRMCGFLTKKPPAAEPIALLGGRLTVRPLEGSRDEAAGSSIMGAPEPSAIETRVILESDGEKLVLMAWELFRLGGDRLDWGVYRDVRTWRTPPGVRSCVEPMTFADDRLRGFAVVPSEIHGDGDALTALSVFVLHPDGLVQFLRFYVNPPLRSGGDACTRLSKTIAETLTAGAREIDRTGGKRRLDAHAPTRELEVDLPKDYVLTPQPGPDFVVYQVEPIVPLGSPSGRFGVYIGDHPQEPAEGWGGPAERLKGPLLGEQVEWVSWMIPETEEGPEQHRTEALVSLTSFPGMSGFLHAFAWAEDAALLIDLKGVLRSIAVVAKEER
jgi:hypothetical protein